MEHVYRLQNALEEVAPSQALVLLVLDPVVSSSLAAVVELSPTTHHILCNLKDLKKY